MFVKVDKTFFSTRHYSLLLEKSNETTKFFFFQSCSELIEMTIELLTLSQNSHPVIAAENLSKAKGWLISTVNISA